MALGPDRTETSVIIMVILSTAYEEPTTIVTTSPLALISKLGVHIALLVPGCMWQPSLELKVMGEVGAAPAAIA